MEPVSYRDWFFYCGFLTFTIGKDSKGSNNRQIGCEMASP